MLISLFNKSVASAVLKQLALLIERLDWQKRMLGRTTA